MPVTEKNAENARKKSIRSRFKGGTFRNILRDWKWIWSFSKKYKAAIMLYILAGIATSAVAIASGVASKYLIDKMVALDTSGIALLIFITVFTAVFSVVFRSLTSRFSAKLSVNMHNDVQSTVFDKLISSDWMLLTEYSTGDLINRFSADISTVANCAVSWLPNVIIQLFTILAVLGVILYYDPIMALIGCASTPLMALMSKKIIGKQRDLNRRMRQVSGGMSAFQSEVFRNIDTLKGFGAEKDMSEKLHALQEDYRDTSLEYNGFHIKTNICFTAMGTAVQYLALGYCLWRLWRGDIMFGTMVLFLQQRTALTSAFSSLVSLIPTALSGSVAAERVRELTELKKEPHGAGKAVLPKSRCSVNMRNIGVGYGERNVLSDVTITALPGETVAVTGPSGEGKTTLLRLLLGLIRPSGGDIFLCDENGKRYELCADTRPFFSYVPQGNTLIAGTVADNLRLADKNADDNTMIAALMDACAWEFVEKLPQGINTKINEGGKGLSEGQAQRIAIARALVRKTPVMLLDEVTSALDTETERRVLKNLSEKGVTCIVTTHRPSVLNMCHRAYRVSGGRVISISEEDIKRLTDGIQ